MNELKDILCAHPLRIRYLEGHSDTLVVSFSGVGKQRQFEPPVEFYGMASDRGTNHVLFVTDISRCWLNHATMAEQIVETITRVVQERGISRIYAVGNSMGGTMALILSRLYPFDKVLAIVPQYSVHPDAVPEETRWQPYREEIGHYRFPVVEGLRPDRTEYVILHGGVKSEQWHALRFPTIPGVFHYVIPSFGHRFPELLKQNGQLRPVVRHALFGRQERLIRILRRLGGQPRDVFAADIAARAAAAVDAKATVSAA